MLDKIKQEYVNKNLLKIKILDYTDSDMARK